MILLDTPVLVWWLTESPGLSNAAKRAIRRHAGPGEIAVSAISVLEIATAARRGRLQFTVPVEQWLSDMRCIPQLRLEPVSADIAALAGSLVDPMHGDPADRMIVAIAMILGVPLVTADEDCAPFRRSPQFGENPSRSTTSCQGCVLSGAP